MGRDSDVRLILRGTTVKTAGTAMGELRNSYCLRLNSEQTMLVAMATFRLSVVWVPMG